MPANGLALLGVRTSAATVMIKFVDNICVGPEPGFNIKISSYQYRKSHCGDKTVVRSSYLHNGISCTGKTTSLYWIGALGGFLTNFFCSIIIPIFFRIKEKLVTYWIPCSYLTGVRPQLRCSHTCYIWMWLTHWGLVTSFDDIDLGQHWLR